MAVTISTASIFIPIYRANALNMVAHIIARKICGLILPIILLFPLSFFASILGEQAHVVTQFRPFDRIDFAVPNYRQKRSGQSLSIFKSIQTLVKHNSQF
jgi:hypothetical protein